MLNLAYKHLDSKIRIADLTIVQWIGVFAGVVLAVVYGYVLHPFGTMVNMVTAVYIGGIPITAVLLGGFSDFDPILILRSAATWRRLDGAFLPGPGLPTDGYRVYEAASGAHVADRGRLDELDLAGLWGEK